MAIKHEDGKVTGSITLRKLFKKVKKALKNFWYRIVYFFNKDSDRLPEKFKKKMKKKRKEKKSFPGFSLWSRICLRLSGCNDLMPAAA